MLGLCGAHLFIEGDKKKVGRAVVKTLGWLGFVWFCFSREGESALGTGQNAMERFAHPRRLSPAVTSPFWGYFSFPFFFFFLLFCAFSQGEHGKQQRRYQQTEPTLASGWEQTAYVQLRGRIFSSSKPGSELGPALAGKPQPRQELRLFSEWFSDIPDPSQPPRPPAPGLAAGTPHVQPGGSGILKARGGRLKDRERRFRLGTEALGCI